MTLLPLFILIAVGALLLIAVSVGEVFAKVRVNKVVGRKHIILTLIALVAIWLLCCQIIVVLAGLSHSEISKSLIPARCLLLFFILVGLPGVSLLLLRYRTTTKESGLPKLKRAAVFVFAILISLILFLAAKSGMWPPLAVATKYHFSCISQSLIKMGVDINEKDVYGYVPIWYAASNGDPATTKLLLERGADLRAWGESSLGQACVHGHRDVAELLIDRGMDVNAVVYEYPEWTLLMAATNAGQLDVVKMLVRKGAFLDMRDKDGKTALMIAEGRRQIQIAEFLKVAKAESIKRERDQ